LLFARPQTRRIKLVPEIRTYVAEGGCELLNSHDQAQTLVPEIRTYVAEGGCELLNSHDQAQTLDHLVEIQKQRAPEEADSEPGPKKTTD
jgi:hypothetical protein